MPSPPAPEDSSRRPEEPSRPQPEHAPGRLIVKLRPGVDVSSLEPLNRRFKVREMRAVFPKPSPVRERLGELRKRRAALGEEGAAGWHPWSGKGPGKEPAGSRREREELELRIQAGERLAARMEARGRRAPEGVKVPDLGRTYLLRVEEGAEIPSLAASYREAPGVEYAEPDYIAKVQSFPETLPNDTYVDPDQDGAWSAGAWGQPYEDLWGIRRVAAHEAWAISQGEGVVVGVIDTGVDGAHPDLAANIWVNAGEVPGNGIDDDANGYIDDVRGWDFAYGDNDPADGRGHGTHVAGTIAAAGNNAEGVIGVAPQAKLLAVKGLDDAGSGYSSDLAAAVVYAVEQGADVLNNSWGGYGRDETIAEAFDYAFSRGVVSIAAVGNSDADVSGVYPANLETVIAVAATTQNDEKASFSNHGFKVDLSAPGGGYGEDRYNILSTLPGDSALGERLDLKVSDGYYRLAGTSMASPHAAGAAALLVAEYPEEGNEAIRARMMASADPFPAVPADPIGAGRVNARNALILPAQPYLRLVDAALEEVAEDDGIPGSNERIRLVVTLENIWKEAVSVSAALSTEDPAAASIPVSVAQFGGLAQGETKQNLDNPFIFKTGEILFETSVDFTLTTNADGVIQALPFTVTLGIQKLAISSDVQLQRYTAPAISGDRIVWEDSRNGNLDIYLHDLSTGEERRITTDRASQQRPAISGDRIVWEDYRNGNSDIYLYDLAAGEERRVTGASPDPYNPAISGDRIVWNDYRNDFSDIYLYDLATGQERRITPDSAIPQGAPAISGDTIVWSDSRNGNADIYLYDLSTGEERRITTDPAPQFDPALSGDRIVWEDSRNGNADIYLYDLSTGEERRITTDPAPQFNPAISGDRIVWEDSRNGNLDIYLHDLSTGEEQRVTTDPADQYNPDISEGAIVWKAYRGGQAELWYTRDPSANQPPAVEGIVPSTGGSIRGQWVSFTTAYTDPDGWRDLRRVRLLTNTAPVEAGAVYVEYRPHTNQLYLRNDDDTGWLGPAAPGSGTVLRNSQCVLDCSRTRVSVSDTEVRVEWRLKYKPAFSGRSYGQYLRAVDKASADTGWTEKGSWRVR